MLKYSPAMRIRSWHPEISSELWVPPDHGHTYTFLHSKPAGLLIPGASHLLVIIATIIGVASTSDKVPLAQKTLRELVRFSG